MPGLGEARKFISPEDREALVNSSKEVKESQGDPERLAEAEENKSALRERISEKMWQEIYRRGAVFIEELLVSYKQVGDLPWKDILSMLQVEGVPIELKESHPDAAELIEGMTQTQKILFSKAVMCMEQDHYDAEAVVEHIRGQLQGRGLTGLPDEIGRELFIACNTGGKNKFTPPIGTVTYHKKGPFIELEMTDDGDIKKLYGYEGGGHLRGYHSPNTLFYNGGNRVRKYFGNSRLIAYKSGEMKTREHEEGHYIYRASERARNLIYGSEPKRLDVTQKRLKDLERLYRLPWNILKRHEIARLYEDALSDLQKIFYNQARSELAASFYAGDYQHSNNLYIGDFNADESGYNIFYEVFGKRLEKVPGPLRNMIETKKDEYNRVVSDQGSVLNVLAVNLRMMGLEPQYRDKINAFILDQPLAEMRVGINKVFGAEFSVAQKYAGLQYSIETSYRVVEEVSKNVESARSVFTRANTLVDSFVTAIEEKVAVPVREGADLPKVFAGALPDLEGISKEMNQLEGQARDIQSNKSNPIS